jgi:hypothetical protein
MPDMANLSISTVLSSTVKPNPTDDANVLDSAAAAVEEPLPDAEFGSDNGSHARILKRSRSSLTKTGNAKSFWDRLTDPHSLPFLVGAPKMVDSYFTFLLNFTDSSCFYFSAQFLIN